MKLDVYFFTELLVLTLIYCASVSRPRPSWMASTFSLWGQIMFLFCSSSENIKLWGKSSAELNQAILFCKQFELVVFGTYRAWEAWCCGKRECIQG